MRNLKRALSLTLASVMLLGMMVVGSSAAAGYDDVADTDNVEAIEVLQAVEVMVGDERGFGPERPVNRAEMAVVMGKLLNLDYNYYEATCPFNDVYDWARGWVGACYANGIVSGRGEGVYDPGTTVTAVEAASMLMRALGYFKYQSDYANGFEVATVSQATKIRLFDGVDSSTNAPLTRNQVAQMVLNALKSGVVEPDGNALNFIDANGNVIATGGKVNYVYTTSTKAFASAISRTTATSIGSSNDGWIVELGEQLYNGSLELRDYEQDVFGRPARTWVLDGSEIGTYVKRELLVAGGTYTEAVKGSTVYTLLGQTTIRDNDLLTYLDGANNTNITKNHLQRSNNADLYGTGRGVLTEVYLDNDHDEITIASINTWLAKATMDYNTNSESITLTVYDSRMGGTISKVVDLEDAPYIEGMKKDDWCLVQWYGDSLTGHTDRTVVEAFDVEIVENQALTAFKRTEAEKKDNYDENEDTYVSELTTGGETYKANAQAWYKYETLNDFDASAMVNKTYTVFMDQYGNFIGVELYSGSDQYVFITGYDRNSSNISVNTATAAGIFTDGTMAAITVNVKDTNKNIDTWNEKNTRNGQSGRWEDTYEEWTFRPGDNLGWDGKNQENMWYKYTLNNNVYTLTPVDGYTKNVSTVSPEREVNSSKVYLAFNEGVNSFGTGNSYGEDASIYITVDNDDVDTTEGRKDAITEVTGVYTGAQSVNLVVPEGQWIHSVWKDNYIVAAIVWGEAEGSVDNYAYIRSGVNKEWIETDNNGSVTHFWDFDAVMNGEKVTKTIKSKFSNTVNDLQPGQVQELILDADGYVTRIKDVNYPINTGVTEDKLYNNEDFADSINNVGTDTLKGKDVYHVETEWTVREGRQTEDMPTLVGTSTYGDYTDLYFQGNTIHYTSNLQDLGLVVTRDAKAVVKQTINGKAEWENYSSVSAAYSILNDANSDRSGKQFCGEIAAVLDSNGRAAWVVFIDNTPTRSKDIDYGDYTYDFTRNGIKFRIDSDSSNDRNTTGTVDRFGDLTVFVPKAITRAVKNPLDVTVQVTVNGIDVGNAVYTESKDTNTFFAYVLGNWALDTSKDEIVVTVIWADDTVVSTVKMRVPTGAKVTDAVTGATIVNGQSVPVGTKVNVAAETGYTVTVNGAAIKNPYDVTASGLNIVAKKDDAPVEGIEFTGTAAKGTDFTVTKNGNSFTITAVNALLGVKVKDGDTYTVDDSQADVTWVVTPNTGVNSITVTVNRMRLEMVNEGGHLGMRPVEVTNARAAGDAARAPITWLKVNIEGKPFVLKWDTINGTEAYWFGVNVTETDLQPIMDAINANRTPEIDPIGVPDADEQKEWGESGTDAKDRTIVEKTSTGYTVNRYKGSPAISEMPELVLAEIKKTTPGAQTAVWATTPASTATTGTLNVTYPNVATPETVTVTFNDVTRVEYKGSTIGYVDRSTTNTKTVDGKFAKGAVLIGGEENVKGGSVLSVGANGGTATPKPAATQDEYYIYDAIEIQSTTASGRTVTIKGYKDGATTKDLPQSGRVAVVSGTPVVIEGNAGTASDINKVVSLLAGETVLDSYTRSVLSAHTWTTAGVTSTWAGTNGVVVFSEAIGLYTVKLGTQEKTGIVGQTLKFTGTKDQPYLVNRLYDSPAGANAILGDSSTGEVSYVVNAADAVNSTITITPAYSLIFGNGVGQKFVTTADKKINDLAGADAFTTPSGTLIAAGSKVWLDCVVAKTIGSKTVDVRNEGSIESGAKNRYSFIMPESVVNDIKVVDSPTVSGDAGNTDAKSLNVAGNAWKYDVTQTGATASTPKPTVVWYGKANGTIEGVKPTQLKVEVADYASNKWVVTFTAETALPIGSYYFAVDVDGAKSAVTTMAVNALKVTGSNLADELAKPGEATITVDTSRGAATISSEVGPDKVVNSTSSSNGVTLSGTTIKGEVNLDGNQATTISGTVTVDGGKLSIAGAQPIGTGSVKLEGDGTLALGTKTNAIPEIAAGSKGTIEIATAVTSKNGGTTAYDRMAEDLGAPVVDGNLPDSGDASANVPVPAADIKIVPTTDDAKLSPFDNSKPVKEYIKNLFPESRSVSFYTINLIGAKENEFVSGERFDASGKSLGKLQSAGADMNLKLTNSNLDNINGGTKNGIIFTLLEGDQVHSVKFTLTTYTNDDSSKAVVSTRTITFVIGG